MTMLAYLGSPTQWFILIMACLLIFGAKRLPEIARSLGKSMGEFKKARREFEEELMRSEQDASAPKKQAEKPLAAVPSAPQSADENKEKPAL